MQNLIHGSTRNIRTFIRDDENTMNSAAVSSIMGFVDKALKVRYGNYTQEKFCQLLGEFCQMVIE